jgi:uncharacterized protein
VVDWHLSIYLFAPLLGWLLAHILKFLILTCQPKARKANFAAFFYSGGMPSAHSALTMATAGVIGGRVGLDSALFALSLVMVSIVAYDSCNVRRAVGEHAEIISNLAKNAGLSIELRPSRGHTIPEVVAGICLGLMISLVLLQIL